MNQEEVANTRRWARAAIAAPYAGFTEPAFRTMRCRGLGPPCYRKGRVVLYDLNEVDSWISEQHEIEAA